jgi:hypothetical protein
MWTGSLSIHSLPLAERGGNHHPWERDGQKKLRESPRVLIRRHLVLIIVLLGCFLFGKDSCPTLYMCVHVSMAIYGNSEKRRTNTQNSKGSQQPA